MLKVVALCGHAYSSLFLLLLATESPRQCSREQKVDISLKFSDELFLETSGARGALPTLSLNNGGEAVLVAGTGTSVWLFSYVYAMDAGTEVDILDVANATSLVNCTGGCRAYNLNGVTADLSVSSWHLEALHCAWSRPTVAQEEMLRTDE